MSAYILVFVVAAVVAADDDVLVFACCCCLFVCSFFSFFPFAKLTLLVYNVLNFYTCKFFLYISPRLYKHFLLDPVKAQCYFFVFLKVDGGQLESLRYFDHHTHFITRTVIILSCNLRILCCDYAFLSMIILCK